MARSVELWRGLRAVRRLHFRARSAGATGWAGTGSGGVIVESPVERILTFAESGLWRPDGGRDVRFRNVFRWSNLGSAVIRLEHLRFGPEHPVLLFDMAPDAAGLWQANRPHLCLADSYSAELRCQDSGINLAWTITGPKKQVTIDYAYRW